MIAYVYRLAIVQATISALRDLKNKGERERVLYEGCINQHHLAPLLTAIYNRFHLCDSHVFFKHQSEIDTQQLLMQPDEYDRLVIV